MSQQDTTEVPFLNVLTIKKKNFAAAARPKIGLHENQKKVKIKLVRLWKKNSKIKKQGLTMWLYWRRRKKRKKIIQKDKENKLVTENGKQILEEEAMMTFLFEKWGF
jgi:hypothetical protein